ncbi:MAG: hypothetical protein Q7S35_02885 [Candidatus Limnocylindrales bacterium]|nr:hypothetical protein [Candidatus Limnocylindrales bacterium]
MPENVQPVIDRALEAYSALAELGEELEDEWSYVNDLADAWRHRLAEVADQRGTQPASGAVSAAVDRAIAEIGLVADPHRAIDWLSTFPQVVLLALGETP